MKERFEREFGLELTDLGMRMLQEKAATTKRGNLTFEDYCGALGHLGFSRETIKVKHLALPFQTSSIVNKKDPEFITTRFIAEVVEATDIANPKKEQLTREDDQQEEDEGKFENTYLDPTLAVQKKAKAQNTRMMKLILTVDGERKLEAMEYRRFASIDQMLTPGTKVVIDGSQFKIKVRRGMMLLQQANLNVLAWGPKIESGNTNKGARPIEREPFQIQPYQRPAIQHEAYAPSASNRAPDSLHNINQVPSRAMSSQVSASSTLGSFTTAHQTQGPASSYGGGRLQIQSQASHASSFGLSSNSVQHHFPGSRHQQPSEHFPPPSHNSGGFIGNGRPRQEGQGSMAFQSHRHNHEEEEEDGLNLEDLKSLVFSSEDEDRNLLPSYDEPPQNHSSHGNYSGFHQEQPPAQNSNPFMQRAQLGQDQVRLQEQREAGFVYPTGPAGQSGATGAGGSGGHDPTSDSQALSLSKYQQYLLRRQSNKFKTNQDPLQKPSSEYKPYSNYSNQPVKREKKPMTVQAILESESEELSEIDIRGHNEVFD